MTTIELPHLSPGVTIQFGAALGLLRVLARHPEGAATTLRWEPSVGTYTPIVTTPLDLEGVLDHLVTDMVTWSGSKLLQLGPFHPKKTKGEKEVALGLKFPRTLMRTLWRRWQGEAELVRFLVAFVCELNRLEGKASPLDPADQDPNIPASEWLHHHPLNVTSRQVRFILQTARMVQACLQPDQDTMRERMRAFLLGQPYLHTFDTPPEGLWHLNKEENQPALLAGAPLELDPLVEWFGCFQLIPLLPAVARGSKTLMANFDGDTWRYPVWSGELTVGLVELLLRENLRDLSPTEKRLRGVQAVYESLHFQRNMRNVFSAALRRDN